MVSADNHNPWAQYETYKDCSQAICSLYCPQWCYIIFPPPPPFNIGDDNGSNFSPLIIAAISIIASAFLLISYYTVISKYCQRRNNSDPNADFEENRGRMSDWRSSTAFGVDEAIIKSIAVCKYKRDDGLIEGTDCSVCLSEFEDGESLRLLPKCNHAFHLPCIDVWLKSHSSCPLCRCIISSAANPPPEQHATAIEQNRESVSVSIVPDLETRLRAEVNETGNPQFRRSISLDASSQQRLVLVADLLRDEDDGGGLRAEKTESSMRNGEDNDNIVLNMVKNPVAMKRSVSTGRFVFSRYARERNSVVLPI